MEEFKTRRQARDKSLMHQGVTSTFSNKGIFLKSSYLLCLVFVYIASLEKPKPTVVAACTKAILFPS